MKYNDYIDFIWTHNEPRINAWWLGWEGGGRKGGGEPEVVRWKTGNAESEGLKAGLKTALQDFQPPAWRSTMRST